MEKGIMNLVVMPWLYGGAIHCKLANRRNISVLGEAGAIRCLYTSCNIFY